MSNPFPSHILHYSGFGSAISSGKVVVGLFFSPVCLMYWFWAVSTYRAAEACWRSGQYWLCHLQSLHVFRETWPATLHSPAQHKSLWFLWTPRCQHWWCWGNYFTGWLWPLLQYLSACWTCHEPRCASWWLLSSWSKTSRCPSQANSCTFFKQLHSQSLCMEDRVCFKSLLHLRDTYKMILGRHSNVLNWKVLF